MSGSNNLKHLIKQAQSGNIPTIEEKKVEPSIADGSTVSTQETEPVEVKSKTEVSKGQRNTNKSNNIKKGKEEANTKKPKNSNSFVERIKAQSKSGMDDHMLHIRVKPDVYQKLLLCGLGTDKLSMQAIATFAIDHLLEQEEMKKLLNNIKNGMV